MDNREIDALTAYTEFRLQKMLEKVEPFITDPRVTMELYHECNSIVEDMRENLLTQVEIENAEVVSRMKNIQERLKNRKMGRRRKDDPPDDFQGPEPKE